MKYKACWENAVCSKDGAGFSNVICSLQFALSPDCTFQRARFFGSLSSHCFFMFTGILCYSIGYIVLTFFFHLQIARMVSALQQQQQRQPGMKHSPSHPVGPKPHLDSMVPSPLNVGLSDLQTKGQIPGYGSGKCSEERDWVHCL